MYQAQDARKKKEMAAARLKKAAKLKRQRELVKQFRQQAVELGYSPKPQRRQKLETL